MIDNVMAVPDEQYPDEWFIPLHDTITPGGSGEKVAAMEIIGLGCLVRSTMQKGTRISQALQFVPGATLHRRRDGTYLLINASLPVVQRSRLG